MPKYKKLWWNLVQQGIGRFIEIEELDLMLKRCERTIEKVLLILLYYTGARPSELLELTKENFRITEKTLFVSIPTKKRGETRTIPLPLKNPRIRLVAEFVSAISPGIKFLRSRFKNIDSVKFFVYKVSDNKYTPYFFRHNLLSILANSGASVYELKTWKGAKSIKSVEPYIRLAGTDLKKFEKVLE
jgi:integrase